MAKKAAFSAVSRLSARSQTVIPRAVRDRLGLKPGDSVRFRETKSGIVIERDTGQDDPFATFTEWTTAADDEAFGGL